jgi:hypothetical protein
MWIRAFLLIFLWAFFLYKVIDHSEGFYTGLKIGWAQLTGNLFPGANPKHSLANKVLEPSFGEPGQCLPLKGHNVYVDIALRTSIFPDAFSLEHVSKASFRFSRFPLHLFSFSCRFFLEHVLYERNLIVRILLV